MPSTPIPGKTDRPSSDNDHDALDALWQETEHNIRQYNAHMRHLLEEDRRRRR